ncbi:MAG: chorismate mutase [Alphaproteobacteria bacterium]|nr:chorismate mutase [Alphaproteobacteria bacterium]MBU2229943.1 chorismate mutase [Alphaproteobacteria bacterium]
MRQRSARGLRETPFFCAIRGAVQVSADSADEIAVATSSVIDRLVAENGLERDQIISFLFTITPDLRSELPPLAANEAGWRDVPMLCAVEAETLTMIPRTIRLLAHVEWTAPTRKPTHVYLPGTTQDRPPGSPDAAAAHSIAEGL